MSTILFIAGCVLGCLLGILFYSKKVNAAQLAAELAKAESTPLKERLPQLEQEYRQLSDTYTNTLTELERHKTELAKEQEFRAKDTEKNKEAQDAANARHTQLEQQLANVTEEYRLLNDTHTNTLTELERCKTELEKERQFHTTEAEKIKEVQERHFAQFRNFATEVMEQNSVKLKDTNRDSMNGLLKPLREQLENLGKAVHNTNVEAARNKASLDSAIKTMMEKAENLGRDAENLTLALRGDTKKQGDWGELILERMLEESGLRKGEEYYIQENHKTDEGRDVRPDVVIRFPEQRCVVVDSKVSLTAYAMYTAAESEEERKKHLAAHVVSVNKHIQELAAKDYSSIVDGTISYVLMFMPNEASYMAALQQAPNLPLEAYRRKIILISPTNLLMALQLAYNLWQKERQTQNVEKIFERATKLYEKLCLVQDSLEKVGRGIEQAQSAYNKACDQLYRGRGNYAKQLDDLRQMGISPAKRLRLSDADMSEEDTQPS